MYGQVFIKSGTFPGEPNEIGLLANPNAGAQRLSLMETVLSIAYTRDQLLSEILLSWYYHLLKRQLMYHFKAGKHGTVVQAKSDFFCQESHNLISILFFLRTVALKTWKCSFSEQAKWLIYFLQTAFVYLSILQLYFSLSKACPSFLEDYVCVRYNS